MADDTAAKEVSASEVLNNHGGVRDNDLLQQLIDDPDSDMENEIQLQFHLCLAVYHLNYVTLKPHLGSWV